MRIALIGHNLPHTDPMVREAYFSDLFFNHQHDNYAAAQKTEGGDTTAGLRLDAEEFITALAAATGYTLDADELVADYLARE